MFFSIGIQLRANLVPMAQGLIDQLRHFKNRPLGNQPHKLCIYSPEPRRERGWLRGGSVNYFRSLVPVVRRLDNAIHWINQYFSRVVRKPVNVNPGLNVYWSIWPPMFGVIWDYYSSKLKGKQYKQNTSPKSYKTEIKILTNPGLTGLWTTLPSG